MVLLLVWVVLALLKNTVTALTDEVECKEEQCSDVQCSDMQYNDVQCSDMQ